MASGITSTSSLSLKSFLLHGTGGNLVSANENIFSSSELEKCNKYIGMAFNVMILCSDENSA